MNIEGITVIAACSTGSGLWPRQSVDIGDIVLFPGLRPGARWLVSSPDDIRLFYAELGIELWSDWQWID